MGHSNEHIHVSGAEGDWSVGPSPKTLQKRILVFCLEIIPVIVWQRMWFFSLLRELPEAKVKRFTFTALSEEISKQLTIGCVLWLLLFILMTFYFDKR